MTSHSDLIIAAPLCGRRLIGWIRAGTACLAQIRITFPLGGKTRARFGRAPTVAGTSAKEITTPTFPSTVFRTEEGVFDTRTGLLGTRLVVITGHKDGMYFGVFDTFQPSWVVVVHRLPTIA